MVYLIFHTLPLFANSSISLSIDVSGTLLYNFFNIHPFIRMYVITLSIIYCVFHLIYNTPKLFGILVLTGEYINDSITVS